jgi:hypothetical protein
LSDIGKSSLLTWGLRATWAYLFLLVFGLPTAFYFGFLELGPITLNELGDFLAGAFGPLALFWLVLGFIQQGRELRNSVATLELQADELRASVEQQKELVSVTRETLAHEKEVLGVSEERRKARLSPKFVVSFWCSSRAGSTFTFGLDVLNSGAIATNVKLYLENDDGENVRSSFLNALVSFPLKTGPLNWPRERDWTWRGSDTQTKTC